MATNYFRKNSVETTHARVAPGADFKRCCMKTGQFDGSPRNHFFQGVTVAVPSNKPLQLARSAVIALAYANAPPSARAAERRR
jgi:hypothetical protein